MMTTKTAITRFTSRPACLRPQVKTKRTGRERERERKYPENEKRDFFFSGE